MLNRILMWLRVFLRKCKNKWWAWFVLLVTELLKDRIFGAINHYIDLHTGWFSGILRLVSNTEGGILTAVTVGTILLLLILAFVETRPAAVTRPRLTAENWRSEGLYDLQANVLGLDLVIVNSETRFHTVANNVRAKVSFQHSLGNRLVSNPGVWIVSDSHSGRHYAESVSIPMGERAILLLIAARGMTRSKSMPPRPSHPCLTRLIVWNSESGQSRLNCQATT